MSGSFQPSSVVQPNALLNLGEEQTTALKNQNLGLQNQAAQNALADRQTVIDSADGVAAGDPHAIAQAMAADPTRAQPIITGLASSDAATRARVSWGMGQVGQAAGAILNLPDSEKQDAWTALRNNMIANGADARSLPNATVPDDASLVAFRKNAIPAVSLLDHQTAVQTTNPGDPLDSPTQTPVTGSGAPSAPAGATGPSAANGTPTPAGGYSQALALSESNPGGTAPNYTSVNKQGYAGGYQFGAARLADLGFYSPAQGENLNANQWGGQFHIDGFPQVRTLQDFLNNPAAQNAVQQASVHDIHTAIVATPGADKYSETGLQAVAHIGGVDGMKQWVATGGKYNPADSNKTTLTGYYTKFAPLGMISQPMTAGGGQGAPAAAVAGGSSAPGTTPTTGPAITPSSAVSGAVASGGPPTASPSQGYVPPNPNPLFTPSVPSAPATYANTGTTPPPGMPALPSSGSGTPAVSSDVAAMRQGIAQAAARGGSAGTPGPQTASLAPVAGGTGSAPANPSAPAPSAGPAAAAVAASRANPPSVPTSAAGIGAGSMPANPNALFSPGVPSSQDASSRPNALLTPPPQSADAGPVPQNPLAGIGAPTQPPAAAPASAPATGSAGASVAPAAPAQAAPAGFRPLYQGGKLVPYGPPELGQILGVDANGNRTVGPMPGFRPKVTTTNVDGTLVQTDPMGRVISTTPIVNMQRTTTAPDGRGGTALIQGGKIVNDIPSTGRDIQMSQFQTDQKNLQEAGDQLQSLQSSQSKMLDQRQLIASLPTGPNAETGAAISSYVHAYMPQSFADAFDHQMSLPGATASQEFQKLALQSAGSQEKDNVGSRGGYMLTQLYKDANPNMKLTPDANRDIINIQIVQNQANQDYLRQFQQFANNSADAFTAGKPYVSAAHFDQQWQAQRNPQVYLGAAQALNGQPYAKWSQGLSDEEKARAVGIVGRVDPTAQFNGPVTAQNPSGRYQPKQATPPTQGGQGTAPPAAPSAVAPTQSGQTTAPTYAVGQTATGAGGVKIRFDGTAWRPLQ